MDKAAHTAASRLLIPAVIFAAFLSYWQAMGFTFWVDDWVYLWQALYDPHALLYSWMHFGTSLEFFLFAGIFGTDPFWWQLSGILLRILAAVAVGQLAETISASRRAGRIAAILFAGAAVGAQAAGWVNAHVVFFETILLSAGVSRFVKALDRPDRLNLTISLQFIVLALLLDLVRALPVFAVLATIVFFSKRQPGYEAVRFFSLRAGVALCVLMVGVVRVMLPAFAGSPIGQHISLVIKHPAVLVTYAHHASNFFGMLWNMSVGWAHPAIANSTAGTIRTVPGMLSVAMVLVWFRFVMHAATGKTSRLLWSMTVWVLAFIAVHWMFEPRIIVEPSHRYYVLPSVGYIILISYGASRLSNTVTRLVCVGAFALLSAVSSNLVLFRDAEYRAARTVNRIWTDIDGRTPKDGRIVFLYGGEDPLKLQVLNLSNAMPLAIRRHIGRAANWPSVADSKEEIARIACSVPQQDREEYVSHAYGWFLYRSGILMDDSRVLRAYLREQLAECLMAEEKIAD